MDLIELKSRLLCEGANPLDDQSIEFLTGQNPQKILRGGLSSGLKVELIDPAIDPSQNRIKLPGKESNAFKVNFPLYSKIPVSIKIGVSGDEAVFFDGNEEIGRAKVMRPPEWYSETVESDSGVKYPISSILTQHNDQLMGSVYEWCGLFNTGEQCKFCVMDRSQKYPELRSVARKAELILKALEKIPVGSYRGIGLNGGMTLGPERGFELINPVVKMIRDKIGADIPIAVEMTPPEDLGAIERFAEAGGTSLMMNLETWDDNIRKELIPGKNRLCPKENYLKAFEKALEVLGKGKVSTCFVVGTEPVESLKEGIKTIVEYNVIPSPLCGRYFEGFEDYDFNPSVDWREFLEVFRFARAEMAKNGLISTDDAGCIACGMCDIVGNIR